MTDSNDLFRLAEIEGKGKVLIATKDMLPGKVCLVDFPALIISKEEVDKFADEVGALALLVAGYDAFKAIDSSEGKNVILSLFGTTSGMKADMLRDYAKTCPFADDVEETELFVKVTSIIRLNAFDTGQNFSLYPTLTRMSHSCFPNCNVAFEGLQCTCRVLQPVRAGEELTVEYSRAHRMQPTWMRRKLYAERKDFTCHCPRCDALGDDTRQFDCFDTNCSGQHYVHQPLEHPSTANDFSEYEGGEYVEPRMLACTECGREAPEDYQQMMFELEDKLPAIVQYFNEKINALPCPGADVLELIRRIECIPYPTRHWASVSLIEQLLYLKSVMSRDTGSGSVLQVAQEYRALYSHVACYPNETFVFALYHMIFLLANIKFSPRENHLKLNIFLVSSCRLLLRTSMIIAGREYNTERVQEILCDRLLQITPDGVENDDPHKCSLCKESASCADIQLKWCGRCHMVTYCSITCQKAHWRVHKKSCKMLKNVVSNAQSF